jgi:hypothetical protein
MREVITGFLGARDHLRQGMDDLGAYVFARNALCVAFVQDAGITDHRILCGAFRAFRRVLTRQQDAYQKLKTEN